MNMFGPGNSHPEVATFQDPLARQIAQAAVLAENLSHYLCATRNRIAAWAEMADVDTDDDGEFLPGETPVEIKVEALTERYLSVAFQWINSVIEGEVWAAVPFVENFVQFCMEEIARSVETSHLDDAFRAPAAEEVVE